MGVEGIEYKELVSILTFNNLVHNLEGVLIRTITLHVPAPAMDQTRSILYT